MAKETFKLVSGGDRCIDVIEFQQWLGKGWRAVKEQYAAEHAAEITEATARAAVEEARREAEATRKAMEELEAEFARGKAVTKLQARSRGQSVRKKLGMLKAAAVATVVVAAAAADDDLVTPPQPAPKEAPIEVTPDKVDDATLEEAPAEKQEQEAPDGPVPDIGGTTVQQVECA